MKKPHGLILGILLALASPSVADVAARPPESTAVEAAVTGTVHAVVKDDLQLGRSSLRYFLEDEQTGEFLELQVTPAAPAFLTTGARVRAEGLRTGPGLRVAARDLRFLPSGESGLPGSESAAASVTGARKVAVLLVHFSNATLQPACSAATLAGELFFNPGSMARFYQESSFQQLSFPADTDGNGQADIFGPFTINVATGISCDIFDVASKADAAAQAAGINLDLYDHRMYILPDQSECGLLGELGCGEFCRTWIETFPAGFPCALTSTLAHEIGHNLGMHHASTDFNVDGLVDDEYGDRSDVMGHCCITFPQPNAPHKDQLGWFDPFPGRVVHAPPGGGPYTYTLTATESSPDATANPQVLRLGSTWYVSTRSATGFDADIDSYEEQKFVGRTSIHRYSPDSEQRTLLTAILRDGESFSDPVTGYGVVQLSHTSNTVRVQVLTPGNCVPDDHTACLVGGRFKVQVDWKTASDNGSATVMSFDDSRAESEDSVFWWFFSPSNFELGVKVLDACGINQKYWIFAGGLTNQGFTIRVVDTLSGATKSYSNPIGSTATTIADTAALDCD